MQKLFSAFPGGWPGLGLLLLRVLVGVRLIFQTLAYAEATHLTLSNGIAAALVLIIASCLLVGFLTPISAVLTGLGAISLSLSGTFDSNQTLLNLIVLATAIGLLGPGAFSIDARMFGRREISIPSRQHRA